MTICKPFEAYFPPLPRSVQLFFLRSHVSSCYTTYLKLICAVLFSSEICLHTLSSFIFAAFNHSNFLQT